MVQRKANSDTKSTRRRYVAFELLKYYLDRSKIYKPKFLQPILRFSIFLILTLHIIACAYLPCIPSKGAYLTDSGERPVVSIEPGSNVYAGVRGMQPNTLYEIRLNIQSNTDTLQQETVSFARLTTDLQGNIDPFVIWYHSGVVGCSSRISQLAELPAYMFRTFDEAESVLDGRAFFLSVHQVEPDQTRRTATTKLQVSKAILKRHLPVRFRKLAKIYPADAEGCLRNSALAGENDMYVAGRHFFPGEVVEISVVPNQRDWYVGDAINDVTGVGGVAAPLKVRADKSGRFVAKVWDRSRQHLGVYDIVAKRNIEADQDLRRIAVRDIISYATDTGYILYLRYPVGGPLMDIAGRTISGSPYFQFADSFADTDDPVWGAVDPTYVPDTHPGGRYAAYYVVAHRDANGWDPSTGGSIDLTDESGGIEIVPVKAGCINGTDVIIWNPPLDPGQYDVVVNFGDTPAENAASFIDDFEYNDDLDFLDGADQIGFVVTKDPYELGTDFGIGRTSYSDDDFFTTLGSATDVDLRAVVRYPATANGDNTPVAAGQHPLFIIEHGNHLTCNITRSGVDPYSIIDSLTLSDLYEYDDCPDRKRNHEGYMQLLDILASHGVIAVSIDAYDLTSCTTSGCRPQWIYERGQLILKHLELWSHLNDPSTYTSYPDFFSGSFNFNNHVDMSKISVSGHSRGGEASVAAYMLNTAFNIGSVSSIAPVNGQSYVLPDVPYFVILPAADGDVSNLSGVEIYDRAGRDTVPADYTTKSSVHIYGANHNFFNTIWADDIDDSWVPRDDYINKADQQRIGEAYLAAFTRIHLLGETVYEDMLRGRLIFPSTAGYKIYPTHHEKSHSKLEDGSLSGTASGGVSEAAASGPSVHETQAVRLSWSSSGDFTYSVPTDQRDASMFEVLSFRVAQTNSTDNPSGGNQNFLVELVGGGNAKTVYAGRFDDIPPPYNREDSNHNVMTTVRIPLHSFIMNNSGVALNNIDTLRFVFSNPSRGEINVDDIEFSR